MSGQTQGQGKKRPGGAFPKGRQVKQDIRFKVAKLLDGENLSRDLLIEYLHKIQDDQGHLPVDYLVALAQLMGLSQAEVYEVASFYHHFQVVKEDETAPAKLTVRVCQNAACHMVNSAGLLTDLAKKLGSRAQVLPGPCMGACDKAPAVSVGDQQVGFASVHSVTKAVDQGRRAAPLPLKGETDYSLWNSVIGGEKSREEVAEIIGAAGLRGLGGAGFPTAKKWQFVRQEPGPRYLVVNADEGEPGTFKDRYCFETNVRRVLEGALMAAWAIDAKAIYIYLRVEYPAIHDLVSREIAWLEKNNLTNGMEIHLRRGAGAYICGEESALLESLEGKRGIPRHKPPFPAQSGLFGQPTLINNVETLYWIPAILRGEWQGQRLYSVSGRVKEPGVKEVVGGVTVQQLIDEHCGGMTQGHEFKAFMPGGASGGILPASLDHVPLDFGTLDDYGCFVGSAAVVILSQEDDPREMALNLMEFFEDESCGQCTPCRLGTEKAVKLMKADKWDEALLAELSQAMADASICGLGQAAPNPLRSVMRFFPEEGS